MTLASWAPAILTLIGWIFTFGLTVGRINGQEKTLVNHDERLDGHDTKLESHAIAIAKMESWKEGYNAGSKQTHSGARS